MAHYLVFSSHRHGQSPTVALEAATDLTVDSRHRLHSLLLAGSGSLLGLAASGIGLGLALGSQTGRLSLTGSLFGARLSLGTPACGLLGGTSLGLGLAGSLLGLALLLCLGLGSGTLASLLGFGSSHTAGLLTPGGLLGSLLPGLLGSSLGTGLLGLGGGNAALLLTFGSLSGSLAAGSLLGAFLGSGGLGLTCSLGSGAGAGLLHLHGDESVDLGVDLGVLALLVGDNHLYGLLLILQLCHYLLLLIVLRLEFGLCRLSLAQQLVFL